MPTAAKRKPSRPRTPPQERIATIADLLDRLGGIPPDRVVLDPPPGTATKRDLLRMHDALRLGLFELVDGTLVRKPMGYAESYLGIELGYYLRDYLRQNDLGYLGGADGLIELMPNLVRGPDIAFIPWPESAPRTVAREAITRRVPRLVAEVLSPSNTPKEIARKLAEYFRGGVELVWVIDPDELTADVYTSPDAKTTWGESGTLDGGHVLPGFRLPLAKLFERLAKPAPKKPPAKKPRKKK